MGYSPWSHKELDTTEQQSIHARTHTHTHTHTQIFLYVTICVYIKLKLNMSSYWYLQLYNPLPHGSFWPPLLVYL